MSDAEVGIAEKGIESSSSSNFPKIETDRVGRLRQLLNKFKRSEKTDSAKQEKNGVVSGERVRQSATEICGRLGVDSGSRSDWIHDGRPEEAARFGDHHTDLMGAVSEAGAHAMNGRIGIVEVSDTAFSDTLPVEKAMNRVLPKQGVGISGLEYGSLFETAEPGFYRYTKPYKSDVDTGRRYPNGSHITEKRYQRREFIIAAQDVEKVSSALNEPSFSIQLEERGIKREGWRFRNLTGEIVDYKATGRRFEAQRVRKYVEEERVKRSREHETWIMRSRGGD